MTKSEFVKQREDILAAMANLEGAELEVKTRELNALTAKFNAETAEMSRETTKASFSLAAALREARTGKKEINVREAITASGLAGKAVETEIQSILEPLYAQSVLNQLGVKWYKDMPMGDISIPVMGKGTVGWKGEIAANADGTPAFDTNVTLKPKRLTGYFEISEKMLLQDTIGVEEALRRDAIKALVDKFEATVLGNEAGTDDKPAGLFYNKELASAKTFAEVADLEATVENANVTGAMKYLLSTKAKAAFRSMAKSAKSTQLVMEGGEIDGTPAITTSNVKDGSKGVFAYGNFENLACASWADLIFKVDDSINYANGLIRIYVSGYFDAAVLRPQAFAFGDTLHA